MEEESEKKSKELKKILENLSIKNVEKVSLILLVFLLGFLVLNLSSISITGNVLNEKIEQIEEANRPAELQLSIINGVDDCLNCFDIFPIVESLKEKNVKIIEEETLSYNDEKAKELIEEYKIKKIPSIVVFGEINKTKLSGFENTKDALIFTDVKPLYIESDTGEITGEVELINIKDSSCKNCSDLTSIIDGLGKAGVVVTDYKNIEYNSEEGKELINRFGIKQAPSLLISEDIKYYSIAPQINQIAEEKDDFYWISTLPPYRNLTTNEIEGLVSLIMLEDSSCADCYDININKQILRGLGVFINDENIYDISSSEGKQLIEKYDIKKVPMIILSPKASVYDSFVSAWSSVGTKENDGWYVMRSPENLGEIKEI